MAGKALALLALTLVAGACQQSDAGGREEATRRERDSALGASRIPGAGGVRGALQASDSAAARNARIDTVAEGDTN